MGQLTASPPSAKPETDNPEPAPRRDPADDHYSSNSASPKRSLQDATMLPSSNAPAAHIYASGRSYSPPSTTPKIECMLVRAQEMARYVEHGALDAGLHRQRLEVLENDSDVEARHLGSPTPRPAAPASNGSSPSPKDLTASRSPKTSPARPSPPARARRVHSSATSPRKTSPSRSRFSWGATEVQTPTLAGRAIVEVTETGSLLRAIAVSASLKR